MEVLRKMDISIDFQELSLLVLGMNKGLYRPILCIVEMIVGHIKNANISWKLCNF